VTVSRRESGRAKLVLVLLTAIWGSTFVVLHTGVGLISPFVLVAARFAVAGLALAIWSPRSIGEAIRAIPRSMPLSLSILAGFVLQTEGLRTTTPARSAFLTALSVVIVPIFDMFDRKRLPRGRLLFAAAVAACGVYGLFHPIGGEWHRGDTLTVVAAVLFAYYIVELDRQSRRTAAGALVLAQCIAVAVIAAGAAPFVETVRFEPRGSTFFVILYLGLVCTAVNFVMMTWAQARVGAVIAAIIYTLEPVIAASISIGIGREPFGWKLPIGGGLVVAAMLVASTDPSEPHPVAPPEGID
jgi:drug/metabolite transporter (DMT)-like permease